ncbi:Subtilase family protein [compost metagenome]
MKKIRVAIIDDGIDSNLNYFNANIKYYEVLNHEVLHIAELNDKTAITSHGTVCSWIFSNYCQGVHYELISIKIIDPMVKKTSIDDLIIALNWCSQNDIQLICMSIGTTYYKDFEKITNIVDNLVDKGIIMTAACNNDNLISFPASAKKVIGVRCDYSDFLGEEEFTFIDDDIGNINLVSSCNYEKLEKIVKVKIAKFNSFAVPYIGALICKSLANGCISLNEVLSSLKMRETQNTELKKINYLKGAFPHWKEEIEAPVVAVISNDTGSKLIKDICIQFHKLGFYAVGMCNEIDDDKFYLIPSKKIRGTFLYSAREMINFVHNAYQPDLLLVIGSDDDFLNQLAIEKILDVRMYIDKAEENLLAYSIPCLNSNYDAKAIAQSVIDYFQ